MRVWASCGLLRGGQYGSRGEIRFDGECRSKSLSDSFRPSKPPYQMSPFLLNFLLHIFPQEKISS